jgi:hypothetical protein
MRCSNGYGSEPAARLCLVLTAALLLAVAVGFGAEMMALGRWFGGVCGDWAPPGWRNDPRCDGSLFDLQKGAYSTARVIGGALGLASVWLIARIVRRKRAHTPQQE